MVLNHNLDTSSSDLSAYNKSQKDQTPPDQPNENSDGGNGAKRYMERASSPGDLSDSFSISLNIHLNNRKCSTAWRLSVGILNNQENVKQ